jgi:hypothetical protein
MVTDYSGGRLCERWGPTTTSLGGCRAIGSALSGFERFSGRLKAKVSSSMQIHGAVFSPLPNICVRCTCLSENHHFY